MSAACIHCDGWGCTHCRPPAQRLAQASGEQGLTAEELDVVTLRNRVRELEAALALHQSAAVEAMAWARARASDSAEANALFHRLAAMGVRQ